MGSLGEFPARSGDAGSRSGPSSRAGCGCHEADRALKMPDPGGNLFSGFANAVCLNSAGSGLSPTRLVPEWGQNHAQSYPQWPVPPSVVAVLWAHALCMPPGLAVTSHGGTEEIRGVLLRRLFAPEGVSYLEEIWMPQYLGNEKGRVGRDSVHIRRDC